MAAAQAAAAAQLAELAEELAALAPVAGTFYHQTPLQQHGQAGLEAQQRALLGQVAARQAEAETLAVHAAEARTRHAQVMRLLCVLVAAQEQLTRPQLASMGFDSAALQALPAWDVLFSARGGVLRAADPTLEAWLLDPKASGKFFANPRKGHAILGNHYRQIAERDARELEPYGLRHVVPHLLLSESEAAGAERLLMDAHYLEQVFRSQEEGTLYLSLARLTTKAEVVAEALRWLRLNLGALRAHPGAVQQLWQCAPSRTLFARLVAAAAAAPPPSSTSRPTASHPASSPGAAAAAAAAAAAGRASSAAAAAAARPQCALLTAPPFWPTAVARLPGHTGGATSLSFCRHNRLLVASTGGGRLLLWDPATARLVASLRGHSPAVPSADLHPSGRLVAVGSSTDATVHIRALDTGSGPLVTFDEAPATANGPEAAPTANGHANGHANRAESLNGSDAGSNGGYSSAGGAGGPEGVVRALRGPRDTTVRQVSYSPDGHLLAVVYGNGSVTLWDAAEGVRSSVMPLLSRGSGVRYACFAPDGQLLALACANGVIRLWHLKHTDPLHIAVLRAYDITTAVRCVLFSPSGLLLASLAEGSREVVLWDVATGHQVQAMHSTESHAPLRALAFSPKGLLLAAAGDDGDVSLWSTNTRGQWAHTACLRGHGGPSAVAALAFSPCGQMLASGGAADSLRLVDVGSVLQRTEALRVENAAVGRPPEVAVLRADEAAGNGRLPAPNARRAEQLAWCRALAFPAAASMSPLLPAAASPLRPAVRLFTSMRAVPQLALRGRSLALLDSSSLALYHIVAGAPVPDAA
ncbi:WD repeat domain-containing protein [Tetrabaena socialis]|uniref:WD repeat domain-containing protein n=1 Tax=Tetrabaena socialis TaxID=47790 RepID=A0A2J8AE07_9CHLO|nr:WD repeat domain-containing protein [Tetrabaena socialis]|eukprot:PNH10755.1 WD repeat domain-containing protein [Tetrabaena socialis]